MSRIGNQLITIPEDVTVTIIDNDSTVSVKSGKLELTQALPSTIKLEIKNNQIKVIPQNPSRQTRALHGLTRSLIANMIIGVTKGYEKVLELHGTGYRVAKKGDGIELSLGFSHPVEFQFPPGITLELKGNNIIKISGPDKQLVGQTAANIRASRPPDAYKGKGIRYQGETVHLKPGKAAKAAGTGEE